MPSIKKARTPKRKVALSGKRPPKNSPMAIGKVLKGLGIAFPLLASGIFLAGGGMNWLNKKLTLCSNQAMHKLHLEIRNILLEGRVHTKTDDVQKAIACDKGQLLIEASPSAIKQRLEALPWVRSAIVQRYWPSTLHIRLIEQYPIAIWQNNGQHYLIDDQGTIIDRQDFKAFRSLPIITGEKAPAETPSLLNILNQFSLLKKHVTGASWVGGRRWDLIIHDKLTVKLPEDDIYDEMEYLTKLLQTGNLENKNILSIDLRTHDRAYFYMGNEAVGRKK